MREAPHNCVGWSRHYETPDNGGALYNLACGLARAGRRDEALARLHEAVAIEDRFLQFAQTDDDLAPIRDDPSFPRP